MRLVVLSLFALLLSLSRAPASPVLEFLPTESAAYSAAAGVHPDAAIVFTRSFEGQGTTFASQVADALERLTSTLVEAGLDLQSVANVRAYIRSPKDEDMGTKMSEWNALFTETFSGNPSPPTRTTIGVSHLIDPDSKIAIDAIVALPLEQLGAFESLLSNPRLSATSSVSPQDLRAISPFSSILVTSGVLADPLTEGGADFGDIAQQTGSVLEKLETVLLHWGLNSGDIAFTRVLLSPASEGEEPPALDAAGFQAGWDAFWAKKRSAAPPFSAFAGPGFSSGGRLVEIEFYAVFPDGVGPFSGQPNPEVETPPVILRDGSPSSFLSSSVAIARDAKKTWFSGVISRDREDIYGQGVEALLTLEERYAQLGIDLADTAQLRAYLNLDGPFRSRFGRWNRAYRRFFDHSVLNPEKPVRTAFPVESLPGSLFVEIETLAATRD